MASRPEVSPVSLEVYEGLTAWARADEGTWDLLRYVDALVGSLQPIVDLVRDTEEHDGWARLLDVNAAPPEALPWLAQFVGVTPLRGLSEEAQRLRIKEAAGWKRGSVASIRAAAQQFLTGTRQVEVYERDGSPWRFRVRTYLSETPNAQAVREAVLALKPAGMIFVHEVQAGIEIDALEGTIGGYSQTIETFSNTLPTDAPPVFGRPYGSGAFGTGPYGGSRTELAVRGGTNGLRSISAFGAGTVSREFILRGVNLNGAEFGAGGNQGTGSGGTFSNTNLGTHGTDFKYPSNADFAYLAGRLGTPYLARLPVRWERLQPTLGGALEATELGRLQGAIDLAAANGCKVIPVLKNEGAYWRNDGNNVGTRHAIADDDGVVTQAHFTDVWSRIATALSSRKQHIAAYGLMNEPLLNAKAGTFTESAVLHPFNAATEADFTTNTGTTLTEAAAWQGETTLSGARTMAAAYDSVQFYPPFVGAATDRSADGNRFQVRLWIDSMVTTGWSGNLEIRRYSGGAEVAGSASGDVALTVGAWNTIEVTATAADLAEFHRVYFQAWHGGANSAATVYVDKVTQGNRTGQSTAEALWQAVSQAAVDAIRAVDTTTPISVPTYGYNINRYSPGTNHTLESSHPSGPWITNGGEVWYEAHNYFGPNDPESDTYAAALQDSIDRGWTAGPNTDALHTRELEEWAAFRTWLNGAKGYVGEVGWRKDEDTARWNALAETVYRYFDSLVWPVTAWASGSFWPTTEKLLLYGAEASTDLNTAYTGATVVEAHKTLK